ncbi:isoprenylcysteine carboxylmethyltransferase family protein [Parvibaculaceae bacterium PLY_AMNH_Bact1]|nr:isoprenylcysteine carboxylmethyltransferase family protein [Parvibaculaceae bacterium PLY_AMNH_Bact1]
MQKIIPPILVAICILTMVALHIIVPITPAFDQPMLAGVIGLAGLFFILSSARLFSRVDTEIHTFHKPRKLVTSGLFRFSRNPIYLGFVLLLLGVAIGLGSLAPFLMVAVFFVVANLWYIPFEEKNMEDMFGTDYLEYKKRTRRWI